MNDKDEKIEYELRAQADENLPDADIILAKAWAEMRTQKKPATKRNFGIIFASLAACAVMVLTVSLGAVGLSTLLFGGKKGNMQSGPASEPLGTYAATELRGRVVTYGEANEAFKEATGGDAEFPLSRIDGSVSVKYSLYNKIDSGEAALLTCEARIYDSSYGYDDLTFFFEFSDETFEGNVAYTEMSSGYLNTYESGEYVSRAYLSGAYRCMFCVMNPNAYRLNHYMDTLFGGEDDAR